MKFFELLARRIRRSPTREVESALFRKIDVAFDRDFQAETKVFGFLRWAPLSALAVLIAVLGLHFERQEVADPVSSFALSGAESDLVAEGADYEFYDEIDDWMLTASDEEWNQLLLGDPGPSDGERHEAKES